MAKKNKASPKSKDKKAKGKCFYCDVMGHWKRNCNKYLFELRKILESSRALVDGEVTMHVENIAQVSTKGLLESENIENESNGGDELGEDRADGADNEDEFDDKDASNVVADQVVFVGLEAIAKIKVPHSLPDEEVEKTNANVSKEEEDDALPCTPLVDKRKRALTLKSLFVDFGLSNLKTTPMELMSSGSQSAGNEQDFKIVTNVNGLYALDDSLFVPVSPELEAKFDE
uniref:CCHC-type domain-containing protein n=1 Tax=Cannabis sativa TaxID=3483 RepID=A0A803QPY9_CANSA